MKISNLFYFISFAILTALSIGIFYIFLPYQIIEHKRSQIICLKNNLIYEIGPNLIFMFDQKPDLGNDKKIRKLCEYSIVQDYHDSLKTPAGKNYRLDLKYETVGSIGDTLLMSLTFFGLGLILIKKYNKGIIILGAATGFFFFLILVEKPARSIYCQRQIASAVGNFKKSASGIGLSIVQLEEPALQSISKEIIKKCIEK